MKKDPAMFKYEASINEILEHAYAYQKCRVLLTACNLDIFTVLDDTKMTVEKIALKTDTDKNALERLLNALCSFNLLEKKENEFFNTPVGCEILVRNKPNYLGNLRHLDHLWNVWSNLTESVRTGSAVNYKDITQHSASRMEDYISAMHWRATKHAPEVARFLNLNHAKTILDLGGGSGAFMFEFLKANPKMEALVVDKPEITPITERYIDESNLSSRIKVLAADFLKDDILGKFDVAFLSQIVHYYSLWENIELFKKIFDLLSTGGRIVIHDFLINEDRTTPVFSALFSLDMLVNSPQGNVYSLTEVTIMLKEAWFSNITRHTTSFGTDIIIAEK